MGLPVIRFHDLRHFAASRTLARNVPLRVMMEVLGHSSVSLTADTYSHVMPAIVQDATEKVADALFGSGVPSSSNPVAVNCRE